MDCFPKTNAHKALCVNRRKVICFRLSFFLFAFSGIDRAFRHMLFFGYGFGGLSQSDAVAVTWPGTLKEGMCVRPGR